MKNLGIVSRRAGALVLSAGLVTLGAACGSSGSSSTSSSSPNSITVAVAYPAPPKALLDQFTKQTGIKVTWVNIGWDDLQTKIAAAMSANTYFADAADVDWSKVGEYQKTGWFYPLNKYFNVTSLRTDMPQLNTFISNKELMGVPFDSSFLVTTVNTKDFAKAGITTMPTTARHPVRYRRGPVNLLVPDDRSVRRPGSDGAGHPGFHLAKLAGVQGDDLAGQRLQERSGA
jgi:multiple sugar transport system substrate-binding protein